MKDPKWECIEPGVYKWLGQNETGEFMAWVERGCFSTKCPIWYWYVCWLERTDRELNLILDKDIVGWEMSLADAKNESMVAIGHLLRTDDLQCTGNL